MVDLYRESRWSVISMDLSTCRRNRRRILSRSRYALAHPSKTLLPATQCQSNRKLLPPIDQPPLYRLLHGGLLNLRAPRLHSNPIPLDLQTSNHHHCPEHHVRMDRHRQFQIRSVTSMGMAERELYPSPTGTFR